MNLNELAQRIWARLNELAIIPVAEFYGGLGQGDRTVFYVLLGTAAVVGFVFGRRRLVRNAMLRFRRIQNAGEALVSRVLVSEFGPPDYHLMNHVTLRMDDGTTQVDHILVSRFGVFVIETKHYKGWLFANAADSRWIQVLFGARFSFQNPTLQNKRHVRAVQEAGTLTAHVVRTTLSYMKTSPLTIRLDADLEELLARVCEETGKTRSEVVREALRRQLALELFEDARRRIIPFAEEQGILTDEDVYRIVS